MAEDYTDRIGRLADKADNFAHAARLAMPPALHAQALTAGMEEIRDELRALYREITDDDPWADEPAVRP